MNLSEFGLEGTSRRTLVVLGAGATRGASFVDQSSPKPHPPLDMDFFQQVSRMSPERKSRSEVEKLLTFIRQNFDGEVDLSMEEFLSEVDHTDRFHKEFNIDPGPVVKKYQKALNRFHKILPEILNSTCSKECEYHTQLAESLRTKDCVMSFNYDCLIDKAIKNNTLKRWDPEEGGYGFIPSDGNEYWRDHSKGRVVENTIRLLKVHGSMNWNRKENGDIELVQSLSDVNNLQGSIIPPTWFKDIESYPFKQIWKKAREEVRKARIIVVIGYSVPETDLFSRSLFKVEAGSKDKREKIDLVVLVNPDPQARRRFIDLINGGLEKETTILQYDTFDELNTLLEQNSN
jgi:hypothetical protein